LIQKAIAMTITVKKLIESSMLGLTVEAGENGLERTVTTAELNRPSLELTGYFGSFRAERIQIFGNGEVSYIEAHKEESSMEKFLDQIFSEGIPCAIITNARSIPQLLDELGNAHGIPILSCVHNTTKLYKRLWENLDSEFAPEITMHGTLMDIHDIGTLIMGKSSVGKSECALELIRRGFHLVADDVSKIKCLSDSILVGRSTDLIPYHMEARGLGIIDISRLFGVASIRKTKRISLVITLTEWDEVVDYDRTGLVEETVTVLDVKVPHIRIPVRPGRNVGTLVEIAALNQKLKNMGIHSARLMDKMLIDEMKIRRKNREEQEEAPPIID
jgi:HPr kinase/phosphorylase